MYRVVIERQSWEGSKTALGHAVAYPNYKDAPGEVNGDCRDFSRFVRTAFAT